MPRQSPTDGKTQGTRSYRARGVTRQKALGSIAGYVLSEKESFGRVLPFPRMMACSDIVSISCRRRSSARLRSSACCSCSSRSRRSFSSAVRRDSSSALRCASCVEGVAALSSPLAQCQAPHA